MSAPSDDEQRIGAYVLGLLDADETEAVRWHLAGCPACQADFEQLLSTREALSLIPPGALQDGPPPDGDDAWQAALHRIRAEQTAIARRAPDGRRPRRRLLALAASVVAFATAVAIGVAIGRSTGRTLEAQPTVSASPQPPGRRGFGVDPQTHVALAATITPAAGWVRVNASVTGVPAGAVCRLLIVRRDGTTEIAGGWVESPKGETEPVVLDGTAPVPPGEVAGVSVQSTTGVTFVTIPL